MLKKKPRMNAQKPETQVQETPEKAVQKQKKEKKTVKSRNRKQGKHDRDAKEDKEFNDIVSKYMKKIN